MDMKFSLELPREALSVPVIRRVLGDTLHALGVTDECASDILIATSEACTNALHHGGHDRRYEVAVSIGDTRCVLKVVDRGEGFDPAAVGHASPDAESGRGLELMRALVDDVSVDSAPDSGTAVYLQKDLEWTDDAPMPRLRPEPEPVCQAG